MLQSGFDMRRVKVGAYCPSSAPTLVVLIVLLVGLVQSVQCQNVDDYNEFDNPKLLPLFTQLVYGDITRQLCTSGETKFYFSNFFVKSESSNYLRPNKNCNLTTWVSGCEPGWACSVGQNQQVNLKNSQNIPTRTHDCQACCEGFFCPRGITCMLQLRSKGIIAIGAARFYWGGQN